MSQIAPPPVAQDDGDGLRRVHLRLWQWGATSLTVLITAWCFSLGWIPGIIALVTAKHVLVAIYVMGIGVDAPREDN
jgi:hypothetical protein